MDACLGGDLFTVLHTVYFIFIFFLNFIEKDLIKKLLDFMLVVLLKLLITFIVMDLFIVI